MVFKGSRSRHCVVLFARAKALRLAEHDVHKAEQQQRRESEWYAAEYIHRSNGIADRPWFYRAAESGNIGHDPRNRRAAPNAVPIARTEVKVDAVLRYSSAATLSIAGRRGARCRRQYRFPSQMRSKS
jgi:hypothetical protein